MYWPIYSLLFSYVLLTVDGAHSSTQGTELHRSLNLRKRSLRQRLASPIDPRDLITDAIDSAADLLLGQGNTGTADPPTTTSPPDNGGDNGSSSGDSGGSTTTASDSSSSSSTDSGDSSTSSSTTTSSTTDSSSSSATTTSDSTTTTTTSDTSTSTSTSTDSKPTDNATPADNSNDVELCIGLLGAQVLCADLGGSGSSSSTTTTTSTSTSAGSTSTDSTSTDSSSTSDNTPPATTTTPPPDASQPTITPPPQDNTSDGGPLAGLGSVVGGAVSDVGDVVSTLLGDTSSDTTSDSTSDSTPTPTPTPTLTTTDVPNSTITPPPDTSTDDGGLGGIIGGVTSIVGGVTSAVGSVISDVGSILDPTTTTTADDSTTTDDSATTDTTATTTSDDGGLLGGVTSLVGSVVSDLTSILLPDPTTSPTDQASTPADPTTAADPIQTDLSSILSDVTSILAPETPTPTIAFPSGDTTDVPTTTDTSTETATGITPTIESNFSFLTETNTLLFTSVDSTAPPATLTDPDQATTTLSIADGTAATGGIVQAPLPTGIPSRIYPQSSASDDTDPSYTLISILFNQELNWNFVATHEDSSSQIFAFFPSVIQTALNITGDQVRTYALQVYVPATYQSAADASQLGTMYLGYIPTSLVDSLAAELKAKTSAFYTGTTGVAQQLADRVDAAFSLTAVPNPNASGSGGATFAGPSEASSSAKARQDAIIGVVSTLGAIAFIIIGFLLFRSWKRRQALAHRRLSDPPDAATVGYMGERPEGREFDQDSIGGQRRRSFYFAEDSLAGYEGDRQAEVIDHRSPAAPGMVQRRNLVPATISAPVLKGSTMNW